MERFWTSCKIKFSKLPFNRYYGARSTNQTLYAYTDVISLYGQPTVNKCSLGRFKRINSFVHKLNIFKKFWTQNKNILIC